MSCCEFVNTLSLFVFFSGTSYSGRGEVTCSAPNEAMLSSGRETSFMPLNQSKNIMPYNQQHRLIGAVCGPASVCTAAAFLRPAPNVHYVRSNQLTDSYPTDPAQVDAGYAGIHMSSSFISSSGSQVLDQAQNIERSFGAVSLQNHPANLKQDYFGNYSPMSGTTPAMYESSGVHGDSHLPAHGWGTAAVLGPRYHHLLSTGLQNLHQQANVEFSPTASSMVTPETCSLSALQTSMQYSAITSVNSPIASSASGIPSPINSPYAGKTYTDASGSEGSHVPRNMQQQYLENLLQLHYLLLASNKLQAPRYPPSLGAHQFDTYIPGSMASVTRPTVFDVSRLSLSPGSLQHGFTTARFPRLAQHYVTQ